MGDAKLKGSFEARKAKALAVQTFPVQRLFDLVRYARTMLHDDDLITDEEYAMLAEDHSAVSRLEDYDDLQGKLARLRNKAMSELAPLRLDFAAGGSRRSLMQVHEEYLDILGSEKRG